ncbi:hypothetical protein NW762_011996 [Fusarium torreyae]|uniref:Uncharacterized protein n=1 Tax=Fusarium torreyae TaxID=1237075 RepID=A0A9W8VBX2_9HYPO|nr:hypothetical protein NW762_011996 [Fusarium torreyae]
MVDRHFRRGSFFTQAARFHDKVPGGLDRLSGFHRDLSQMLTAHLDDYVDFYPYDARSQVIPPPHYQPILSRAVQSFRDHGYVLRPVFRALYIFVDDQAYAEDHKPLPVQQGEAKCFIEYRQRIYIHLMSRVTVLLVKSGDESSLSSPISFLPLFDVGLALDVNREDYKDGEEPSVARVTLDIAIHSVWELLKKEEAAAQEAAKMAERSREEQTAFCEAWPSKVIAHSQEIGIDGNGYSWLAIRRALARENGEAFDDDQVNPVWEWSRHWTA